MRGIAFTMAVGLFSVIGCKSSEERKSPAIEAPPSAVGGGPQQDAWERDAVIDRFAHARCEARERCGAIGGPTGDHTSFGECVEVARSDLRSSFGAASCESYRNEKVQSCARELGARPCGSETSLGESCVEAKLCLP